MTIYLLDERLVFPDPRLTAHASGARGRWRPVWSVCSWAIPWGFSVVRHEVGQFSGTVHPNAVRDQINYLGRTLRKTLHNHPFEVTYNRDFSSVIETCARVPRKDQDGTWLNDEMIESYSYFSAAARTQRHGWMAVGWRSLWSDTQGVFGESMFSLVRRIQAVCRFGASFGPIWIPADRRKCTRNTCIASVLGNFSLRLSSDTD